MKTTRKRMRKMKHVKCEVRNGQSSPIQSESIRPDPAESDCFQLTPTVGEGKTLEKVAKNEHGRVQTSALKCWPKVRSNASCRDRLFSLALLAGSG